MRNFHSFEKFSCFTLDVFNFTEKSFFYVNVQPELSISSTQLHTGPHPTPPQVVKTRDDLAPARLGTEIWRRHLGTFPLQQVPVKTASRCWSLHIHRFCRVKVKNSSEATVSATHYKFSSKQVQLLCPRAHQCIAMNSSLTTKWDDVEKQGFRGFKNTSYCKLNF